MSTCWAGTGMSKCLEAASVSLPSMLRYEAVLEGCTDSGDMAPQGGRALNSRLLSLAEESPGDRPRTDQGRLQSLAEESAGDQCGRGQVALESLEEDPRGDPHGGDQGSLQSRVQDPAGDARGTEAAEGRGASVQQDSGTLYGTNGTAAVGTGSTGRSTGQRRWVWRTALEASEPYWDGWYRGLSELYLAQRVPKARLLPTFDSAGISLVSAFIFSHKFSFSFSPP